MKLRGWADFCRLTPEGQQLILMKLTEWSPWLDEHPDRWFVIFETLSHRILRAETQGLAASFAIRMTGRLGT